MEKIVSGFLFSPDYKKVVLYKRAGAIITQPTYFDAISSKLKSCDKLPTAMAIALIEKAGLYVNSMYWQLFHTKKLENTEIEILYYHASSKDYHKVISLNEDEIKVFDVEEILTINNETVYSEVPKLIKKILENRSC